MKQLGEARARGQQLCGIHRRTRTYGTKHVPIQHDYPYAGNQRRAEGQSLSTQQPFTQMVLLKRTEQHDIPLVAQRTATVEPFPDLPMIRRQRG